MEGLLNWRLLELEDPDETTDVDNVWRAEAQGFRWRIDDKCNGDGGHLEILVNGIHAWETYYDLHEERPMQLANAMSLAGQQAFAARTFGHWAAPSPDEREAEQGQSGERQEP